MAFALFIGAVAGPGSATAPAAEGDPLWHSLNPAVVGDSLTFAAQPAAASLTFTRSLFFSCSLPALSWPLMTFTGTLVRGADGTYTGSGPINTPEYVGGWSTVGATYSALSDSFSIPMSFTQLPVAECANFGPGAQFNVATRVVPLAPPTYPPPSSSPYPTYPTFPTYPTSPTRTTTPYPARRTPTAPTLSAPRCGSQGLQTIPAGTPSLSIRLSCAGRSRGGGSTTIEIVTRPRHGSLSKGSSSGYWTYRPAKGFVGSDRFTYRATNDVGASPEQEVRIRVRRPTAAEEAAVYTRQICASAPSNTSCRAGRNRRTAGGEGTGKVSHGNWPAISGVYLSVFAGGSGSLTGGGRNDELLGHHGNDELFGRDGSDVLWGDWDPYNNTTRQRDVLEGGAGRDFIYTSHGRNTVRGGVGDDFIWAFYGHGTIDCGPGNDKVRLSGREGAYKLKSCERRGKF